ncbi:MAG: hypothetical protein IJ929_10410 [Prevotella sp.]|nr:hypothetical protein [Prevotella sp.]
MMKTISTMLMVALLSHMGSRAATSQTKATVRFDVQNTHQRITGFGGFVCSPQFGYNHMSTAEIKKVWGASSTVGCNIMRLYIPIGRNAWQQSLATAKQAKQMGLIVFASPWGQPAEWKTNGTVNAKNEDGTTGKLKRENWADYAQYLEDYVQYLRNNGVELDAISIQNEPDWPAQYAGCLWDASEIAEFVKTYGKSISCKVMAPETLAVSDSYANALNKTDVLECFDIYGGHQYGGIQSAYKNLAKKGKEIWMTEYLINWNETEGNTRNFDFSKDFFNFFTAINTCMLGDFNAWIHYAAKRYYGMMGDGQRGAGTSGTITKRGYIMAHFAKFITGMTRIDASFGANLQGSAYLSQSGDTIVAVLSNSSDNTIDLTFDLPFYTQLGVLYTTGKSQNFKKTDLTPESETCRPVATIDAKSVATALFVKSSARQPSNMTGSISYYDYKRIDDLTTTKTTFGTAYKLSGKSKTFNHSNPLISSRTDASYGYVKLDEGMKKLVFEVKTLTSNMNYSSALTTLTYVNSQGEVMTHNYGDMEFPVHENFQWVFDLSTATLTDGCIGLISLTNNNWSSNLQFTFGNVYLTGGSNLYAGTLSGDYVADDSYVLDFSTDPACTSIDMTAVTNLPTTLPWLEGNNRVVYVSGNCELSGTNVVKEGVCASLVIDERFGPFHPAQTFTATQASYTCEVDGQHIVQIPFQAVVPEGVNAYILTENLTPVAVTEVAANQPLLVEGHGVITFLGSGEVSYASQPLSDDVLPIETPTAIRTVRHILSNQVFYDLHGKRINTPYQGIIIRNGKKYVNK